MDIRDPGGFLWKNVQKVVWTVHFDNPSLFWLNPNDVDASRLGDSMRLVFRYTYGEEECRKLSADMERVARDLYDSRISEYGHEYDVEMAVHDFLASEVTYMLDRGDRDMFTAVGPLIRREGVCDGISQATSYLLNCYGVRCGILHGPMRGSSEKHSWNIVFLGNEAYHLDVTWDLWEGGKPTKAFFNVTDADMRRSRDWKLRLKCDSVRLNYHRLNGLSFGSASEAGDHLHRNLRSGKDIEVKVTGNEDPEHVMEVLLSSSRFSDQVEHIRGSDVYGVTSTRRFPWLHRFLRVPLLRPYIFYLSPQSS